MKWGEGQRFFVSLLLLFLLFFLLPFLLTQVGVGKEPFLFQTSFLLLLVGAFFGWERMGSDPERLETIFALPGGKERKELFFFSFLAGVSFQGLSLLLGFLMEKILSLFHIVSGEQALVTLLKKLPLPNFFLFFLPVLLLAPLVEEWIFRHTLYREGCRCFPPRTALFLQSMVFALVHWNIRSFPALFLLGLYLGWNVKRTRTLWGAILPHFFFNLTTMMLLLGERFFR